MPRYRYKKALISARPLGERIVVVQRIGDGIAVLKALGEGNLTVQAVVSKDTTHQITIPIDHLINKNEEAVMWLLDAETDVAIARALKMKGRQVDPAACGRWPGCPREIQNMLDEAGHQTLYRLRHFAALSLTRIRILEHRTVMPDDQRAALDARLDSTESRIAFKASREAACRDLLNLR